MAHVTRTLFLAAGATLLMAGVAAAADLPSRAVAPAYIPPPPFTWTGFSVGLHTNYAFSDRQPIRTVGNTAGAQAAINTGLRPGRISGSQDGFANVGGGVGYDYQFTPGYGLVVGLAADATWTDLSRRRFYVAGPGLTTSEFRQSLDYLGTVRGRVGYAFDRFLVYGTGGFAWGDALYRSTFYTGLRGFSAVSQFGQSDRTETGYVYGGGFEYAIPTDSFLSYFNVLRYVGVSSAAATLKIEYLRYDLGSRNVLVAPQLAGAPSYTSRFSTEGNLIRAGFTYRFGSLGY